MQILLEHHDLFLKGGLMLATPEARGVNMLNSPHSKGQPRIRKPQTLTAEIKGRIGR